MASVVLLRGGNVGGHRTFRPAALAAELKHLGALNIGAAGTFVIRATVSPADLRAEVARRLPFEAHVAICAGSDIVRLVSRDPFAGVRLPRDAVRFVSVLSRRPRCEPPMPARFPASGRWLLRILERDGRFVLGAYRRHMKVIGYLGALDRLFGVPATTRNWNTIAAIAASLDASTS
jgi:uncharacterized protein (DUF1697 family)